MNRALTLKWFAVLGLASLFYLLAPRDVSPQMPLYLGMTSAAVIIWTFDLLPAVAVAAALTFLYLLTNMAPPEVVLGPWTTVLIWTTFGAAIFGEAMEKTGLAKRVALRCMLLTGGTFTGMLIGFAIGGIILGILGFMVEPWTGVNAVYVLCLVALFCYMPGMKIMEPSSFNNLNIVFLVFVAGCMAIGFVAGEVGANKWAVSSIIPFLKELPPTLGVLCSYLAGVVTNLLLTPFAATVAFTPAFGELGVQMGVNPLPLFYAFEYGLDQYFFPYEGVMFLYIFTTGCVTLKHVIPTMIARCIVAGAFIAVIAIPYWTFIGIM